MLSSVLFRVFFVKFGIREIKSLGVILKLYILYCKYFECLEILDV